jgi:hypothetical protein
MIGRWGAADVLSSAFDDEMKRIWGAVKLILTVWGGLTIVAMLTLLIGPLTGFLGQRSMLSRAELEEPSAQEIIEEAKVVLRSCPLGEERFESVVHRYASPRGFPNDHLDALAIRTSPFAKDELTLDGSGTRWQRCDQLTGAMADALQFVGEWRGAGETDWFPTLSQLKTSEFFAYPDRIVYHGDLVTAVTIVFVRPADGMVFYFDCQT